MNLLAESISVLLIILYYCSYILAHVFLLMYNKKENSLNTQGTKENKKEIAEVVDIILNFKQEQSRT